MALDPSIEGIEIDQDFPADPDDRARKTVACDNGSSGPHPAF